MTLFIAALSVSVSTGIRFITGAKSDQITILVRLILPFILGFPIAVLLFSRIERLDRAYRTTLRQASELARRADTDPLTGLLNRRSFESRFDAARMLRSDGRFILADMDYLKSVNDRYGHITGDDAIVATARALEQLLGVESLIARIGGDEFCAYMPGGLPMKPEKFSAELNSLATAEFRNRSGTSGLSLSISIGISRCRPGASFRDMVEQTDRELYRNKDIRHAAGTTALLRRVN